MNRLLWILQVLIAMHTFTGAIWKFSHSAETLPSLQAIPHGVWLALIAVEFVTIPFFLLPAVNRKFDLLAPIAAFTIAAEMIFFVGVALVGGQSVLGEIVYWLVIAVLCGVITVGRLLRLRKTDV